MTYKSSIRSINYRPEIGWHVPTKLYASLPSSGSIKEVSLMSNPITTSYKRYIERTKSLFELLDSIEHQNLYHVYPHRLVCDNVIKGRCITHDENTVLYSDDDHSSHHFAAMINDLIIEKISKITRKNKTLLSR